MTKAKQQTLWCMMGHTLCYIKCWKGEIPAGRVQLQYQYATAVQLRYEKRNERTTGACEI